MNDWEKTEKTYSHPCRDELRALLDLPTGAGLCVRGHDVASKTPWAATG